MIIRAKAPLRVGLAGGGSDVSPYCDEFGGAVLNVTINMYAYCTIEPLSNNTIEFFATDRNERLLAKSCKYFEINNELILHKGIYNRIVREFNNGEPLSFRMITYSDAPAGSGLGSSSTMVVAILKAYMEWLNLPLGEYDMAKLAYEIERIDLKLAGGKQDQYAATFGGLNYMEFFDNNQVIVNPLKIKKWIKNEIENELILYYTGTSRDSAKIIEHQIESTRGSNKDSLNAMHRIKKEASSMKNCILTGDFKAMRNCLKEGWEAKKRTSSIISNEEIENIYEYILLNGGEAAKISGAGGGGFMMIMCDPKNRFQLIKALEQLHGKVILPSFTETGCQGWTLYE